MRRRTALVLAAGALTLTVTTTAAAQSIHGRVVQVQNGAGVAEAHIVLLDADGAERGDAMADSSGVFYLPIPAPGAYVLRAEHIAYRTVLSPEVSVGAGELLEVELRVDVAAIPLEPLVVTERAYASPGLREFYRRMNDAARGSAGHYVTREAIERRQPGQLSEMLRTIPRVRVHSRAGGVGGNLVRLQSAGRDCAPRIFIDGSPVGGAEFGAELDDMVTPYSVEGIEVYRGPAEVPIQYFDPNGCGAILVWTRRGERHGGTLSLKRALLIGGAFAALFFIGRF